MAASFFALVHARVAGQTVLRKALSGHPGNAPVVV